MIELYDYQQESLQDILACYRKGYKSVLFQLATGGGKTVIFSEVCRRAVLKGNSVLILVHRYELIKQIANTLNDFGVDFGIIAAGTPQINKQVMIASVQTLIRRLDSINDPTLIICDECHRITANTYTTILKHYHTALVLGVTATPCRTDGTGLNKVFDVMVNGASASELMKMGRLAKPIYYAPPQQYDLDSIKTIMGDWNSGELENKINKSAITGDCISHYQSICNGASALCFCISIKHAENVARQFNEAGIPSANIDGTMTGEQRVEIINKLKNGQIKVLVSVDLLSEGFDVPAVDCVISLRPTQSLVIFMQQIGRGLRIAEGKSTCIVLDHANNIFRHGAIENITDWTLEGGHKRAKSLEALPSIKRCKKCFVILTGAKCQVCGSEPEVSEKELEIKEGELQRIELEKIRKQNRKEQGMARTLPELLVIAKKTGKKPGWAYYVYNSRINKGGGF
ncbi:MAG: DEAD/DEAH box helicase [Candidatus Cloacimonetes bacterium]|nr:DEAD/DEAH box helicase [Candidatus Cloacimonadota bacterium]